MWCRVDGLFGWPFGTLLLIGGPQNQLMTKMLSLLIISVQRWSMTAPGLELGPFGGLRSPRDEFLLRRNQAVSLLTNTSKPAD